MVRAIRDTVGDGLGLKHEERGGDGEKNKRIEDERGEDKGVKEVRKEGIEGQL